MGWISVGLLLFSGGCILYRHPPPSIIQLLKASGILRKVISRPQSQPAEETSLDVDDDSMKEKPYTGSAPSISIGIENTEELDSSEGDPRQVPTAIALSPPLADSPHKTGPSLSNTFIRSPPSLKPPTFNSMPPPPRPSTNAPLRPPPSAAASLRVPTTKTLSTASFAPSRLTAKPAKSSRQVTLKPGHSPLDWAALTSDPNNKLRGKDVPSDKLIRVPPSQLKHQNGRKGKDAWTVYQGKVYNITPYLPFHPGGEGELTRGAGQDAAKLFMEVHPWVNWEAMLGECLVGILVGEDEEQLGRNDGGGVGELDEMD
jgi:cytochrome b involved in lipid metabolism